MALKDYLLHLMAEEVLRIILGSGLLLNAGCGTQRLSAERGPIDKVA
jgi:hypothetical protein